jgi:hypothetical protein
MLAIILCYKITNTTSLLSKDKMLLVALIEAASFFCPRMGAKKLIANSKIQMLGKGMLLMLLISNIKSTKNKKLLHG